MNYTKYGKWHIYENMNNLYPFAFFHNEFHENQKQGFANTLDEAKSKIDELEGKS